MKFSVWRAIGTLKAHVNFRSGSESESQIRTNPMTVAFLLIHFVDR